MPRLATLIASLSLASLSFASNPTHAKRCTFVDDGFVAKDCGSTPTTDQLAQFLVTQASQVAQLKITNPCGFTTCPKMKRDVEFSYSSEKEKRQESMLADNVPVSSDAQGNLAPFNNGATSKRGLEERQDMLADSVPVTGDGSGVLKAFNNGATSKRDLEERQDMLADNVPVSSDASGNLSPFNNGATSKRSPEPESVLDTRSLSHEELLERGIDLDEDELIARNLPTMRTGDGRLVLFGSRSVTPPEPVKRDLVDELHEQIRRGEVEPEVERDPVERSFDERDLVDAEDEEALVARNLPVGRDENGNLYLFGTRSPAPAMRE